MSYDDQDLIPLQTFELRKTDRVRRTTHVCAKGHPAYRLRYSKKVDKKHRAMKTRFAYCETCGVVGEVE